MEDSVLNGTSANITFLFSKDQRALQVRELKEYESQRKWIITVKQCVLDITGQLHLLTDNSCDCIHKLKPDKNPNTEWGCGKAHS